jgi:hypothetical protein
MSNLRVIHHLNNLLEAAKGLSECYEENPELNNIQPIEMQQCIPMSLDEWSYELENLIQKYKEKLGL